MKATRLLQKNPKPYQTKLSRILSRPVFSWWWIGLLCKRKYSIYSTAGLGLFPRYVIEKEEVGLWSHVNYSFKVLQFFTLIILLCLSFYIQHKLLFFGITHLIDAWSPLWHLSCLATYWSHKSSPYCSLCTSPLSTFPLFLEIIPHNPLFPIIVLTYSYTSLPYLQSSF